VVARIIHACKTSQTDEQMNGLLDDIESHLPAVARERDLLSWDEIETMASGGLVRFGSHTRRHTRLLHTIAPAQLDDEINGSLRVLRERLGRAPKTFCYPNGDHSAEAVARVRASYLGAVTTRRGWSSPGSDRFLLARVGVHEDVSNTPSSFLSRLAGV
jgi:peptidoglycan/xylan/chitin deacetylase (PgdA/CDA1 family)